MEIMLLQPLLLGMLQLGIMTLMELACRSAALGNATANEEAGNPVTYAA